MWTEADLPDEDLRSVGTALSSPAWSAQRTRGTRPPQEPEGR